MKRSVAVLPFKNWSADPEDGYFSDGVTEEIINALAQIHDLNVLARTSSFAVRSQGMDIQMLGNQLGVDTVLQGSIRRDQGQVRISAQLINVKTGYHLFSISYDRPFENIFELQDEISLLIADRLREEFGHFNIKDQLVQKTTNHLHAYDYYLKGRHWIRKWDADAVNKGFAFLRKALEIDVNFALPHLELQYGYLFQGSLGILPTEEALELGWEHIQAAKRILPDSADLYLAEASHYFWHEWDAPKANQYLQKALSLRPSYPDAFLTLAVSLMHQEQYEVALEWIKKAQKLDPLSAQPLYYQGMCAYWRGDYENAIKAYDNAIQVNTQSWFPYLMRALSYLSLKKLDKATIAFNALPSASINIPDKIGGLGMVKLLEGDRTAAYAALTDLEQKVPITLRFRALTWKACLYTQLGEPETAIDLIATAVEQKFGMTLFFPKELFLKPLLEYPRFKALMQKVMAKMNLSIPTETKSRTYTFEPAWTKEKILSLAQVLEKDQLYLQTDLNLRSLAKVLQIHPNQLSQLINEKFKLNFNTFLNQHRLRHFLKIAKDPKYQHLTILGLAYESGFKSKTVFNSFFKKEMHKTPSVYLKNR